MIRNILFTLGVFILMNPSLGQSADAESTVKALRMAHLITGGTMPTNDPLFVKMVDAAQGGRILEAAQIAANSKYFATYLGRRLAIQMQTPSLDTSLSQDNDATTFLLAHFVGVNGQKASLSTIWSENASYSVKVGGAIKKTADLTKDELRKVNWLTDIVQTPGQKAKSVNNTEIAIPQQHVGGYLTLSDRPGDKSFANYGIEAGTNLRMIAGIWQVATGMTVLDFSTTIGSEQTVKVAPRFVPRKDPNFMEGQGQPACIACHGGGVTSLEHGYATVADIFDFTPNSGLIFIETPTSKTRKSLGSNPAEREAMATCIDPLICNPESQFNTDNQAWDVSSVWSQTGFLDKLGWTGPLNGNGLNSFGRALGSSRIVYSNFAIRIINEICPTGAFTKSEVDQLANSVNPFASPAGSDDIRTVVALVASHPSCL